MDSVEKIDQWHEKQFEIDTARIAALEAENARLKEAMHRARLEAKMIASGKDNLTWAGTPPRDYLYGVIVNQGERAARIIATLEATAAPVTPAEVEASRLRGLLLQAEWGNMTIDGVPACPWCHNDKPHGHYADCPWVAALTPPAQEG